MSMCEKNLIEMNEWEREREEGGREDMMFLCNAGVKLNFIFYLPQYCSKQSF